MCNILRQKHYFKVNGDFFGVGRLLGITWVDLLWPLETGQLGRMCHITTCLQVG